MAGWRSHPKIQEAKRKGAPMWYVVQVETGREKTACDDIKQAAEDVLDECFVPQYLTGVFSTVGVDKIGVMISTE